MNKRKLLTLAMTLCMVAILAIGGTMAYFTDYEQKENTMVIGNIKIDLDEYMKDENGNWVPFENDKFILNPVSNTYAYNNIFNKRAEVFNHSTNGNEAYLRTVVLFEKNDMLPNDYANEQGCCPPGLHFAYASNKNNDALHISFDRSKVYTVGTEQYYAVDFSYSDKVAVGDSVKTLDGVWMDKGINSEQIKGWGTDGKVSVIVLAQGIQAQDLTYEQAMATLGEITQANVDTWVAAREATINSQAQ